jgi:ABC-type glutathione transport system ATPase component
MTPLLEFDAVSKSYRSRRGRGAGRNEVTAVRRVSLAVARGEILALVGESGAGKSTMGRLALGLERPDDGTVRLEGTDLTTLSARERRVTRQRTHLVLQDPYQALHPAMRIRELVAEPLAIAGVPRRQRQDRVERALEEVSLLPAGALLDRYAHELSGGQRQRVAFARALVGGPELVVADEPVSMLDVSLQADILDLIFELRRRHAITFVFVTHDLAVARHVADRIGVMSQGRLLELGSADEVVDRAEHPYTRALLAAVEELAPPPTVVGHLPPGGHPCDLHGSCDGRDPRCIEAEPVLVTAGTTHRYARHIATDT